MLKTLFKTAWRSALRQKQFTLLNLLGLSIGITTCLLITLYVHHELSYDSFQPNRDRVYRIDQSFIWGDWDQRMSAVGPNVAVAIREEIPEFEEVTRVQAVGFYIVSHEKSNGQVNAFKEDQLYAVDDNFFKVFPMEIVQGDSLKALSGPGKMVITESMAKKYFGNEDAIGKIVETKFKEFEDVFSVSAVVKDPPTNSHLQFDFLTSIDSYPFIKQQDWKWIWTAFSTYGLVKEGTDPEHLEKRLQQLPPKYAPRTTETIFNQSFEDFTAGNDWSLYLNPLPDIYMDEFEAGNGLGPTGNLRQVQVFVAIGLLTLLLSCINFMNLSTARSANRSKEVGVRKVLGAGRGKLMTQFMFESLLFTAISTVIAIVVTEVILDPFNQLAGKELSINVLIDNPYFLASLGLFVLVVGVISGSYPSFYLSSFKPIAALRGKVAAGFKGKGIRNGLVVFQFTISVVLVICAFFVQRQLAFTSNVNLGYDKDNLLQLHNIEQFEGELSTLQNIISQNPAFSNVGHSNGLPPSILSGDRYKDTGSEEVVQLSNMKVDEGYLSTLAPKFLEGRNFDKALATDKYGAILNESAVKMLGWHNEEEAIVGRTFQIASGDEYSIQVIGVVEDFNFLDLKNEIGPLVILHMDNDKVWDYQSGVSFLSMRLNQELASSTGALQSLINELKSDIQEIDPSFPFEYSFMDQAFETSFRSEQRMGQVLNLFTFMAIAIACLGLFGLAAFSAEQRKKELGVRKVLGAKVSQLMIHFSTEFTRLVLFSLLLAIPLAYFAVRNWLNGFAYKTTIAPMVFVMAGAVALLIALATISIQSVKVANRNPIDSLRDE